MSRADPSNIQRADAPLSPQYLQHIVDWRIFSWPASRIIALGRLLLVTFALAATYIDPPDPAENLHLIYVLMGFYFAFAFLGSILVYYRLPNRWEQFLSHAIDISVVSCLIYLTERPSSPFFVFFTFILLSSTLRWNWQGVVATTAVLISVFLVLFISSTALRNPSAKTSDQLSRGIARAGYLLVAGVMLAYVSGYRERNRRRLAQLAAWPGSDAGATHPLPIEGTLAHVARLMEVTRILIIWDETDEPFRQVALWTNDKLGITREPPDRFGSFVAPPLARATFEVTSRLRGITPRGRSPDTQDLAVLDPTLREVFEIDCALTAPFGRPHCGGRVFLLDQSKKSDEDLDVMELIATRIGMELEHQIMQRQIEAVAAMSERVRLARDLHDGILQSLAAACINLHVIAKESHGAITNQLAQICTNLFDEQRRIREFVKMNRLNPSDDTARIVLADELQSSFFRLQQQWSFSGNVTVSPSDMIVSPILARHLRHLMMEAVSNAVRHGKASRINILAQQVLDKFLQLDIHDDGKGFEDLEGAYDDATVSTLDMGPRSLRARVKELGGTIDLETSPSGSRLKVQVPLK